ncbi:MAG: hypothetical protein A4E52_02128 [Pelotomaculum sp. PtaB.Bin013]|nr:MAG: hypothetical protein A4E52_02128 [Pelotomaculum sp. PtaB.Bin013]
MILIIVRSIRLFVKRSTTWEQPVTDEGSSSGREDISPGSFPPSELDKNRFKLKTPGEQNRESGDLTAGGTAGYALMQGEPGKECNFDQDSKISACRQQQGRHGRLEPFDDLVCAGEFVKGFIWFQILGPRGGMQAKKGLNK